VSADVSARLAWPNDAPAIAQIQRQHWLASFGETIAEADLAATDESAMAERWAQLISAPPDARIRTLVALERANIRGFALVHPCHDPDADQIVDGEIGEFAISTEHQRNGHGARLLQACADTLSADGFKRGVWWVSPSNDTLRAYLLAAGWDADGAHREFEGATGPVKQIRLHTSFE